MTWQGTAPPSQKEFILQKFCNKSRARNYRILFNEELRKPLADSGVLNKDGIQMLEVEQ
jgi:hypothetical protein